MSKRRQAIFYPISELHWSKGVRRKHRWKHRLYKHLDRLEDKTVIIVAGYEKSGSSWLSRLLAQALGCPSGGLAGDVRPSLREVATEGLDRTVRPDLVVLKSHCKFGDFSRIDPARVKLLAIVRDPRDIVLSGMHYHYDGKPGDDEKALRRLRGNPHMPGWQNHVREFVVNRVPLVRYEDLLHDTEACVRRIFDQFGLDYCPDRLQIAIRDQSFAVAKARYARTGERDKFAHARSGRAGGYRTELSPGLIRKIELEMSPLMGLVGYAPANHSQD